jgi:hypothetical protein
MDEISMSTEPKIYDPADVERATGHALPRVRHLAWALVDREGVIELRIASVEPVRQWDPVRIPAAWIEHIKQLVVEALDNMLQRLEELDIDEQGNFVAAELADYEVLLTGGPELWISLVRERREIAAVTWRYGADFCSALAAAEIVLLHHGLLGPAGPGNY